LDVAVEVILVFVAACFFTTLYMLRRTVVLGMLSAVCWWTASTVFLVSNPTAWGVVWLLFGIGVVFMVVTLQDLVLTLKTLGEEREEL